MGNASISVLHVDTERGWRGGQQQAAYLLAALHQKQHLTAMVCPPASPLHDYCMKRTLPHFPMHMFGELDFTAGARIARLCHRHGFSIVHLHSAHALSLGLWAKYFLRSLTLIAMRRVDFHIGKNRFSQFKYRHSFVDKIVCISNAIQRVLMDDGIPEEKLLTIHSGIDTRQYAQVSMTADVRLKLGIPRHHVVIGTIAAMAGHKDYPNLLRAARIVLDARDDVTFIALGNGPEEHRIMDLYRELRLGERFIFTGFQKDVGNYLKIFDIFVLASRREGMGTSILDAQSAGLPVVACATGGIPEVVFHDKNGLLVPPGNERALADAMLRLADDPALRKRLGMTALDTVKQFDIQLTVDKYIRLYDELAS